jgi:PmbA protein
MSELHDIAAGVVAQAAGDEEIEAFAARGTDTEIRIYEGEIESLSTATSAGIGIRVLVPGPDGARVGVASAGSLDPEVVSRALASARENAAFASPDPMVVFASPDGVTPAAVDLVDPSAHLVSIDEKIALAKAVESAARSGDPRIRSVDNADYGDSRSEMALVSTMGISATAERTSAYVSAATLAGGAGETQTGSGFSIGRGPRALDPDAAARDAVERSVRMLGASKGPSMRTTVVFDPRVTSTILGVLSGALSGDAVVRGRSFFDGHLGEAVAVPGFTLVDDPTDLRAYGASALDGEGLACRRNVLIDGGVLQQFVYDTVSARRAGATPTGSAARGGLAGSPGAGCRALVLTPGDRTAEELLSDVGEGLYVQSITGVHSGVSTVSGDFSVGAEGLMIRDGRLAEPIREVTVASTFQKMLMSIVGIGADLTWLPGVAAGQTLAIGDVQVSGS